MPIIRCKNGYMRVIVFEKPQKNECNFCSISVPLARNGHLEVVRAKVEEDETLYIRYNMEEEEEDKVLLKWT